MRKSCIALLSLALGAIVGLIGGRLNADDSATKNTPTLDQAFSELARYDWGAKPDVLAPIDEAVAASHGDPARRKQLEECLAAVLNGDAPRAAKDYVCRKLAILGTSASVPALAPLLADKDLSHMARHALERIPSPEADAALREALPRLPAELKVGVIASIGVRRDRASVKTLAALLSDKNELVAATAARALGSIGDVEAANTLLRFSRTRSGRSRRSTTDAMLICAERLVQDRQSEQALAIYESIQSTGQAEHVRLAATRGMLMIAAEEHDPHEKGGPLLNLVIRLMGDSDEEFRALALQQIRRGAGGRAATEQCTAQLSKLPPQQQADLLEALAERGDRAALAAFTAMAQTASDAQPAAIRGLGSLGDADQVPRLVEFLATAKEPAKSAARQGLLMVHGKGVNDAIAAQAAQHNAPVRAELIGLLAERRALDAIPYMLASAASDEGEVRAAAMEALAEIADTKALPQMVKAVLKATPGKERDAAEKAVMLVCRRAPDAQAAEEALLWLVADQSDEDQAVALLPMLGRVGGSVILVVVEETIAQKDPKPHEAGMRALCNWPDASVAGRLLELAEKAGDSADRAMALAALIRVAPLPDDRPAAEKLDLMKKAMALATLDSDRKSIIRRTSAIRSIESLRFVVSYLDQPALSQDACNSIVELARHKELREPNKAEFDKALDVVIRTSTKADIIDRAQRYQKGQT